MNLFEYPAPYLSELKEMYDTPYRFSKELRDYVQYMFEHPTGKQVNRQIFTALMREFDTNDMLKHPYYLIRYYQAHPQQFGHAMENIVPHLIVAMWKCFLGLHKHLRGQQFNKYYPADMKLLMLGKGKFLDIFLSDIANKNMVMDGDEMVKKREGVGLRERKVSAMAEGGKEFEYLCSLE